MNKSYLYLMIFAHIVDDYYLQGILATLKQKAWWRRNVPQKMYRHDYLAALIAHAFSWSFMIMLPIALAYGFRGLPRHYGSFLIVNMVIHAVVDHQKANRGRISLITDQSIHLIQILVTFMCFMYGGNLGW